MDGDRARDAAEGELRADLLSHAAECDGVARAAATAETQVRHIKADWAKIQRMADRWGITIDVETEMFSMISRRWNAASTSSKPSSPS